MLDPFLPHPALIEADSVDVLASPEHCYRAARSFRLNRSPLARALFRLRTLPERLSGHGARQSQEIALSVDEIVDPKTGFMLLSDEPGLGFAVGCIGRFWEPNLPVKHLSPKEFADFNEPGWGKLAWAIYVEPHKNGTSRISFELRVAATDADSWKAFQRYFRMIGPFSHWIRRHVLHLLKNDLGDPQAEAHNKALPGDELVPNANDSMTHSIEIEATPEAIWPYLIQMGRGRAGFYSFDLWDNGGIPSADHIEPGFQSLNVGDLIPTNEEGSEGFYVAIVDAPNTLVLLSSTDLDTGKPIPPDEPLPSLYWRTSWAFVLEAIDPGRTRLLVRARMDSSSPWVGLSNLVTIPVHHFMQLEQLHNLKWRAEGKREPAHSSLGDVGEGAVGALGILLNLITPMLRRRRSHWGLDESSAARAYPGDEYVPNPQWYWTHGIEIDAPPARVWPWIAQIGQDKAGFYSYQWLENLAGSDIQNADHLHAEWQQIQAGGGLRLHKNMEPMRIMAAEPGQWFVAHIRLDPKGNNAGEPKSFAALSWLFFIEALDNGLRSRVISRFRADYSQDWAMRLSFGPLLTESVGFVMDRRMLLGIKERVMASKI